MGMMDRFLGANSAVTAVTQATTSIVEALTPSATRSMELDAERQTSAMAEHQAEFSVSSAAWFDKFINGLNRLPRPLLTLGTIGLFVYAMADPAGFSLRMNGLDLVPEPLWWLMGAIVSFYFGAREAHYLRRRVWPQAKVTTQVVTGDGAEWRAPAPPPLKAEPVMFAAAKRSVPPADADFGDNAALADWAAEIASRPTS